MLKQKQVGVDELLRKLASYCESPDLHPYPLYQYSPEKEFRRLVLDSLVTLVKAAKENSKAIAWFRAKFRRYN